MSWAFLILPTLVTVVIMGGAWLDYLAMTQGYRDNDGLLIGAFLCAAMWAFIYYGRWSV